jgi:hypothetical protein
LAAATFVILIAAYFVFDGVLLGLFGFGDDWAPLWVAGRLAWTDPSKIYDFAYVTQLQVPLVHPDAQRPFVYPPTALLFFSPLAILPFQLSLALFVASSVAALERASSSLGAKPLLWLLAPPVVLAAIAGQPNLIVTALIVYALIALPRAETKAGMLLGIAAAVKPPLLILAPLALVAGRHWRALGSAAATASALVLLSVLLFGIGIWQDWLASLPSFQALVTGYEPLLRNTVTAHATAIRFGIDPWLPSLLCALLAAVAVFLVFARSTDPAVRLVTLVGGALLVTPYGMNYELAALAPAVGTISLRRMRDGVVPAVWAFSLFLNLSVIGLVATYCWGVAKLLRTFRADDRAVHGGIHVAT